MPETVTSLKTTFINSQIRLLSRPLELPDELADKSGMPDNVLENVLREANLRLRRHNKSVYDTLATRSVAEQIDSLYWNAGTAELRNAIDDAQNADDDVIRKGDDLTDHRSIERLPEDLPSSPEYAQLYEALKNLSTERAALLQKLQIYVALRRRVAPFHHPQDSVQSSLVTRDAGLNEDLASTRRDGLRFSSQAAGLKGDMVVDETDDLNSTRAERTKLMAALNSPT